MKLDHDEMRINEAFRKFSTMQVDTEKLKKRVGDKMKNNRKPRRRIGFVLIAAAVMVLLAGTAYAAAGLGMFDRFVDQHDAPFINIVEPVEEFMVIEGVRIDIIAAQQFGNQAIMYMSMQDITGQNRITEETRIAPTWPMMGLSTMIHFNEATNTAYFELSLTANDEDETTLDYIDVGNLNVFFTTHSEFNELLQVQPADAQPTATMPIPAVVETSRSIAGELHHQMLVPALVGQFPEMPYNTEWISGIAVIDGYLHVQLGQRLDFDSEPSIFGGRHLGDIILHTPSGETSATEWRENTREGITPDWVKAPITIFTDKNLQPVGTTPRFSVIDEGGVYMFREFIFRINANQLQNYVLTHVGGQSPTGFTFDTNLQIDSGDNENIRILNDTLVFDFVTIDSIVLTPFGIRFVGNTNEAMDGNFDFDNFLFAEFLTIETTNGNHELHNHFRLFPTWEESEFTSVHRFAEPIEVDSITAIIADGVRISVAN